MGKYPINTVWCFKIVTLWGNNAIWVYYNRPISNLKHQKSLKSEFLKRSLKLKSESEKFMIWKFLNLKNEWSENLNLLYNSNALTILLESLYYWWTQRDTISNHLRVRPDCSAPGNGLDNYNVISLTTQGAFYRLDLDY